MWYDREIYSPTELMRFPLATPETGVRGVAYMAGEPSPYCFTLDGSYIAKNLMEKDPAISDYEERDEAEEELTPLTWEERDLLDLD